jgi:DNA-binding NarL/FixJ family response regulator
LVGAGIGQPQVEQVAGLELEVCDGFSAPSSPTPRSCSIVLLPGVNGIEVCRRLREQGHWVRVLMLTARDTVDDRVRGLDVGADDYLTKRFSFAELFAPVCALIRRGSETGLPPWP